VPEEFPPSAESINKTINEFAKSAGAVTAEINKLLTIKNSAPALSEQIDALKEKIQQLRTALKCTETWSKELIVTGLISLLALVVAVLTFFYSFLWLNPDIRLIGGSNLSISYEPTSSTLHVGWRLVVANYGRKMDVINWTGAKLTSIAVANSVPIELPQSSLILKTHDVQLSMPFTLKENSATEIDATASQKLGTGTKSFFDRTYFTQQRIQRKQQLTINFGASNST